MSERKHVIVSAGYWFDEAHEAFRKGDRVKAMICWENAYNHLENALVSSRRDHTALQKVLVGESGLSAILEATRLRELHPLSTAIDPPPTRATVDGCLEI